MSASRRQQDQFAEHFVNLMAICFSDFYAGASHKYANRASMETFDWILIV